jgi:hypothetical protein
MIDSPSVQSPSVQPENCSVCLEPIDPTKNIATTACGHIFHASCLFRASQSCNACPLCRAPLYEVEAPLVSANSPPEAEGTGPAPEEYDDDNSEPQEVGATNTARNGFRLCPEIIVLMDFIDNFPNDAIMSEIHNIYHHHYGNQEIPIYDDVPENIMSNMSNELQNRTSGMMLFMLEHLVNHPESQAVNTG